MQDPSDENDDESTTILTILTHYRRNGNNNVLEELTKDCLTIQERRSLQDGSKVNKGTKLLPVWN